MIVDDARDLLQRDGQAGLAELFSRHRQRLWRMVRLRIDSRLQTRVDPDDILQEAYLDAAQRIAHFLEGPGKSFYIWIRWIVGQTLVNVQRRHLGARMRDAYRENTGRNDFPSATSVSIAHLLVGHLTSPSQAVLRAELAEQLERALDSLNELDREVLVLRHFEDMSNQEVAEQLGIGQKAASMRYVRALERLKDVLSRIPLASEP